jgi:hypothetical protein
MQAPSPRSLAWAREIDLPRLTRISPGVDIDRKQQENRRSSHHALISNEIWSSICMIKDYVRLFYFHNDTYWQTFSLFLKLQHCVTLKDMSDISEVLSPSPSYQQWRLIQQVLLNISIRLLGPPLWSSGQGSWLQIQRSGFDSQSYQIFWEVVGLEWVHSASWV